MSDSSNDKIYIIIILIMIIGFLAYHSKLNLFECSVCKMRNRKYVNKRKKPIKKHVTFSNLDDISEISVESVKNADNLHDIIASEQNTDDDSMNI